MQRRDRGILIAFEGIDGAGKTTQAARLAEHLRRRGETPICSREPTGGPWGQKIRCSAQDGRLSLAEELEAFTEDRKEHVRNLIQPALDDDRIVILDRYFYSTIAYQGARGGDALAIDQAMHTIAPEPDVVFLLDVAPETGLHRIRHGRRDLPNAFEQLENLRAVRAQFLELAQRHKNVRIIDGNADADDVQQIIIEAVDELLGERTARKP